MVTCANQPPHDDPTHPSSHTKFGYLCTPEKVERLHCLHGEARNAKPQNARLKQKIAASIRTFHLCKS